MGYDLGSSSIAINPFPSIGYNDTTTMANGSDLGLGQQDLGSHSIIGDGFDLAPPSKKI